MRTLPAPLQAHLDTGATTLSLCWRITRSDGAKLGFTDHDHDLQFDGVIFEAATGFTGSEIASSVGLSVDTLEVESVLTSEKLSEADLGAGLFDNAEIEIFLVNWQDTEQRALLRFGNLGEVSRGEHAFTAEVRGLAHALQQPKGRLFQYACDADLGDGRCQADLDQAAFKGTGTVDQVLRPTVFTASGIGSFAADWFARGLLTWDTGANAGRAMEVKRHAVDAGTGTVTLELWQRMSEAVQADDQFTVTAGCDKTFATCRDKFANVENFRGFPHIPGNDFAQSYPNRDDPENDGGSLFG